MRARGLRQRSIKRGDTEPGHGRDMLDLMALANASRGTERATYIRTLLQRTHTTTVLLRVCHDMRFISHKVWGDSMVLLDSIGKQGGGWLKSSRSTAPAA